MVFQIHKEYRHQPVEKPNYLTKPSIFRTPTLQGVGGALYPISTGAIHTRYRNLQQAQVYRQLPPVVQLVIAGKIADQYFPGQYKHYLLTPSYRIFFIQRICHFTQDLDLSPLICSRR